LFLVIRTMLVLFFHLIIYYSMYCMNFYIYEVKFKVTMMQT